VQLVGCAVNQRHVRLVYQPPASSTFLSEQISHQQPANSIFLSEQISTSQTKVRIYIAGACMKEK
jgi:hypothetical protein